MGEKKKMMRILSNWCDKAWLFVVYTLAIIMSIVLLMNWEQWYIPQKLIGLLAISIPMHIFEENTYPGGFFFMNNLTFGSNNPMMYPQNRVTNMVTNLGAEIIFILLTINAVKMEAAVVTVVIFFGIVETVNHAREGIGMYKRYREKGKKTFYAPGLVTSLFTLLPQAACGILWLSNHKFRVQEILAGIGISVGIAVCLILIPFGISIRVKSQEFSFKSKGYFEKYE